MAKLLFGMHMKSRVITALIGIPILGVVIFAGEFWFSGLVILLAGIGAFELGHLSNKIGFRVPASIFLICVIVIVGLSHFITIEQYENYHLLAAIFAFTIIFLTWQFERFKYKISITDWLISFSTSICLGGGLAYAILLRNLDEGIYLTFWLIAVVMVSDMSSFFVGRRFGKHKLAPKVSPMKTIEGAIGGIVGALVASSIMKYIYASLSDFGSDISIFVFGFAGVLVGCIGIIGDLSESKLKRMANVKDSGSMIPGHGGVLDRLDSILFNLPVTYYGFLWVS